MKLDIWDTAGQDAQNAMTRNFYQGSHIVLIVYGIDSASSFRSVDKHFNDVKQFSAEDAVIFLVGNKCDLDTERMNSFDDLQEKAAELGILGFETSALAARRSTLDELF